MHRNFDVICFFTPGGVKSLLENFPKFKQNGTRIGAFGANTFKAAEEAGLTLDIKGSTATGTKYGKCFGTLFVFFKEKISFLNLIFIKQL